MSEVNYEKSGEDFKKGFIEGFRIGFKEGIQIEYGENVQELVETGKKNVLERSGAVYHEITTILDRNEAVRNREKKKGRGEMGESEGPAGGLNSKEE